MTDYRFFLSYSRRDAKEAGQAENSWFVRLRKDLIRDVAKESTLPANYPDDEVAFYDRDGIDLSDPWRASLLSGLQESRVIVCLYSQNYFASEYCGKEFQVFLERVKENKRPNIIIPVLWDAPTKLPEPLPTAVADNQFTHSSLGAMYADKGLLYLLRMQEETEYQRFLQAISVRIAKAGATPLPAAQSIGSLDTVASAFHKGTTTTSKIAASPDIKGVNAAWLVYVAGAHSDYATVRTNRAGYGSAGFAWKPYHPDSQIVGAIATNVVSSKGLFPDLLVPTDTVATKLTEAEDSNTMVLIIVDPWTVRLSRFDELFKYVDLLRLSNCGLIIAWNTADAEFRDLDSKTKKHWEQALEDELKVFLSRTWNSKDVTFYKKVPNEQELRMAIGNAIDEIRARIFARGTLLRGNPGVDDIPILPAGAATPQQPGT